jgi:hypothetical protein
VDNIGMDVRERGWEDVDWMNLAWAGTGGKFFVKMVMNLWIP